jgi:DNA mismatch repair protein MutS
LILCPIWRPGSAPRSSTIRRWIWESGQVFRPGFDAELDRLQGLAQNGKQLIAELEAKEKARTGISSLKIRYNKVFGYYLEVTRTNLKLVPKDYIRKQTTVNAERYYTEELKTLETES